MSKYELHLGDCLASMREMPSESVNCCVTSPPYFGLRDYGVEGQIGLEKNHNEYIATMVDVFRDVRRLLRDDGTLWLNMGDSFGKDKQLLGIPWRLAFALQEDGWILRQDIIWHKPNPMPESVRDRCTKSHEYVFLLSKSPKYFFDSEEIKEPAAGGRSKGNGRRLAEQAIARTGGAITGGTAKSTLGTSADETRNRRSVWTVSTQPYKGAHFATFPPGLIEPCILAGCPVGGTVLDPFGGSGTTAGVALAHGRNAVLCELNPDYAELVQARVESILARYGNQEPSNYMRKAATATPESGAATKPKATAAK